MAAAAKRRPSTGVVAAIAVFLVWQIASQFEHKLEAVRLELSAHQEAMTEAERRRATRETQLLQLLTVICISDAGTEAQRASCLAVLR